ncbi:hypothetical protein EV361DRAFT_974297 [Lentinula raphanica]|uniref:Uncharacterized protein n=1 Tax=Lentinula raphanica TaxID=153919 RepID=A0AA38P3X7_9AGAR|nr:hypothetical protein F5878DRAFT_653437 [Lentinula raphanica]KAJ3963813.1 hypothetical protein EV361DRAFT_974297 [Lentinula raphanica]
MERLAERRMQREEEAIGDLEDDSEDEDEDRDGVDNVSSMGSKGRKAEETKGVMTEEQKMDKGKRMFSVFAARMFERRVWTAYREKATQEH